MEKKSQKPYLTNCNFTDSAKFMTSSSSILLIILLKEFMKLNASMKEIIKMCTKIIRAVLNTQTLKVI